MKENFYLYIFIYQKEINKNKENIKEINSFFKSLEQKTEKDKKIKKTLISYFNNLILGYQKSILKCEKSLAFQNEIKEQEKEISILEKQIQNWEQEKEIIRKEYNNQIYIFPDKKDKLKKDKKTILNSLNNLIKNNEEKLKLIATFR